ncbi:MAG: aldo/keto reductase, partial [Cyanobacteria bacterium P01_H01_bin.58]
MHYRRFGKTGLQLSVFSLGTMRSLSSETTFHATVKAGLQQGINHIETARGYGQSEVMLGRVLQKLTPTERSRLVVTTKIPPTPDAATMASHLEESLARLQVDTIDCLAVHGINTAQHLAWIQDPDGCMPALRSAQATGKIRHIGFSTHGSTALIQQVIATGFFAFVNLHYYYFQQRHASAIAQAHKRDMGIFIISPADKGGQLYTPPPRLRNLCVPYDPLHLTYRWLLSDPRVTTLSVGPAIPEELTHPLAVGDRTEPLTSAEQEAL